ncbi:MAG TPA: zinc-binding dehydrogenase [Gemmatimonadaceae bacterium]|nr:zinc-binding dehydrogenase [Gemmatimonadaceae bacterium]
MRGLTISEHGGLDKIEYRTDLIKPEPKRGEIRVRVRAAALNHLDLFVLGGGLPGVTITPPWVLGADATGVIDAVGDLSGVADNQLKVGDVVIINGGISDQTCEYCKSGEQSLCVHFKMLGEHLPGTLGEYITIPARNARSIPRDKPFEQAAAFTLSTLTAWRMIVTRARVKKGENVLIWGIGGGVALAALEILRLIGAKTWVTSHSEEKLALARGLGADNTLNYTTTDVGKEIRTRTSKRGIDVVLDTVGEATWTQSLVALGRRGRLVTCGATSGPIVQMDVRRLFWNQWDIMGSTMGNDSEFDAVTNEFRAGRLTPLVDSVFDITQGRQAFERLASGQQFGKIVVRIPD